MPRIIMDAAKVNTKLLIVTGVFGTIGATLLYMNMILSEEQRARYYSSIRYNVVHIKPAPQPTGNVDDTVAAMVESFELEESFMEAEDDYVTSLSGDDVSDLGGVYNTHEL